jgi:AraC-like DNA-binding protein
VRLNLIEAPESVIVEVIFVGLPRHRIRQNVEFGVAVIVKALREATARKIRPSELLCAFTQFDLREFERFYLCPVEFASTSDLPEVSDEALAHSADHRWHEAGQAELRRSLALQDIKDPGISLSQIAWLLGYEGSTSFNHAFLRWTGRPPSALRSEKRLPAQQGHC